MSSGGFIFLLEMPRNARILAQPFRQIVRDLSILNILEIVSHVGAAFGILDLNLMKCELEIRSRVPNAM